MGKPTPRSEFDMFDPEPFLTIPPGLLGAARPHDDAQRPGPEAAALEAPSAAALPTFATGGSLASVVARRLQQVEEYGHTPASDAALKLDALPRRAMREAQLALEDLTAGPPVATPEEAERLRAQRVRAARKKLIDMCAIGLAAIERIDREADQSPTTLSPSKGMEPRP